MACKRFGLHWHGPTRVWPGLTRNTRGLARPGMAYHGIGMACHVMPLVWPLPARGQAWNGLACQGTGLAFLARCLDWTGMACPGSGLP